MSNILSAIMNIVKDDHYKVEITKMVNGSNRANNMGEGLEMFVKNAFANSFDVSDYDAWNARFWSTFSFQGVKSKIPDMVLKGAEAIEVKKTESLNSLQLNSSHPKAKLFSDQNVSEECRICEEVLWKEKDMIYVMGHIPKKSKKLKSLWFVYGTCYAAKKETYQDIVSEIKCSLAANANIEINVDGKELGKVINIDSLNATGSRIRGMWVIKHPSKLFEGLYKQ
ncbi:MAG: NgoPII family restriction endonuclease, partial [Mariprofundales bacterium]